MSQPHFWRQLISAGLLVCGFSMALAALPPSVDATSSPSSSLVPNAPPQSTARVRFGFLKPMYVYGRNNYQPGETDIRRPLEEYLQKALPDIQFEFVEYPLPELGRVASEHGVDFALMSAGQFVEIQSSGAYALATVYTSRFPDPNRFTGALFVVSSRFPGVRDLADLKGLRAAFNSRANFINYQIPLGEVARQGFDPDTFFSEQMFTNDHPEEVLQLITDGRADVGVFRICEYEALMKMKPEFKEKILPVGVRKDDTLACMRSTDLYPGWTVTMTSSKDTQISTRIVKALLAMPVDPSNGMGWSVATDFHRVNEVFRLIKAGPYAYLREWTLTRIWHEYWQVLLMVVCFIGAWIAHWLSVEKLAERRARELTEAYVRQRSIEDKALKAEERLAAMSRLGVVSQLSSIFAHEMGQPLSAIRYRAKTLETLFKHPEGKDSLITSCLHSIAEQGEKAARILQKVRDYAKGETSRNTPVRLDVVTESVLGDLRRSGRIASDVNLSLVPVTVEGDELELGLAVLNILKNAAEATGPESHSKISVRIVPQQERVRWICENEGRPLEKETLLEHMTPMSTSKKEGIGLGLIIISSIAEAHGGSFTLSPREAGGAIAVLDLPLTHSGLHPAENTPDKVDAPDSLGSTSSQTSH